MLNKILTTFHILDGFLHWVVQRFSALCILFTSIFVIFSDSLYFFVSLTFFLFFHMPLGVQTLIDDYVHDDVLFLFSLTLLRIVSLFFLKFYFFLFLC